MNKSCCLQSSLFVLFFSLSAGNFCFSQTGGVGINNTGALPNAAAALDINFNNKGILIPRLNTSQRNSINPAATGLLIYNSDCNVFNYYNGSLWVDMMGNVSTGTAPAAPIATAATGATSSLFTANWSAASSASSYALDIATDSNFITGFTVNNLNVGNVLTYTDTGLVASTTYYYRIRAINSCGTSGSSNSVSATTSAAGIAFDAAGAGSAENTNVTFSHTCTGSNLVLIVTASVFDGDVVTGATYNGISMTLVTKQQNYSTDANRYIYLYYLMNPPTGTYNVIVSRTGTGSQNPSIVASSASYTGALQTGQVDSYISGNGYGTSYTLNTMTTADKCWIIATNSSRCCDPNSYTFTRRAPSDSGIYDSNGPESPRGS